MILSLPERSALGRRTAARLCRQLNWAALHEVPLPNGRRADVLALRADCGFVCIEVKSGAIDFLADSKWHEYRAFCDQLFFAVDTDFPLQLLPAGVGVIVTADDEAAILRDAPNHPLASSRRRVLLQRFARLAAIRLHSVMDPADMAAASYE